VNQQILIQPLQSTRASAVRPVPELALADVDDGPDRAARTAHDVDGHEGHGHDGLFDRLGAFLGLACAIHCVAMPLLLGVLPALGLGFLADHVFDLVIVVLASIFAFFAARSGLRSHGDRRIAKGFVAAVLLLALGHLVGEDTLVGRIPSVLGGLTLAVVHFLNLRASRRSCPR